MLWVLADQAYCFPFSLSFPSALWKPLCPASRRLSILPSSLTRARLLASRWDRLWHSSHPRLAPAATTLLPRSSPFQSYFSHPLLLRALPLYKLLGMCPKTEGKEFFPWEHFRNNNCQWNIILKYIIPSMCFWFEVILLDVKIRARIKWNLNQNWI